MLGVLFKLISCISGASSVFGRYVGSPVSMHSGNSSDTDSYYGYTEAQLAELRKRGLLDKNSDMYKAKRERNNIAVSILSSCFNWSVDH